MLAGLFASAFLTATLLPGGSKPCCTPCSRMIRTNSGRLWASPRSATRWVRSSYLLGRLIPERKAPAPRALAWLRRGGAPVLLLSWAPIIGDALCVAAGWLRLPLAAATLFIAAGKFARYWVVAQAAL